MPRTRHPIHPLGTYYLHGDGKPRRIHILQIGSVDRDQVRIRDRGSIYWVHQSHLRRNPRPAPRAKRQHLPINLVGLPRRGRR